MFRDAIKALRAGFKAAKDEFKRRRWLRKFKAAAPF